MNITLIVGCLKYGTITKVNLLLSANTASIHPHRGNRQPVYLVLTMALANYATITGISFIPPQIPGAILAIPDIARTALITNLELAFKQDTEEYKLYFSVNETLKQQLLVAVEVTYYCGLCNRYMGYAANDTQEI